MVSLSLYVLAPPPRAFSAPDLELHVFDLDAHQQKEDFAHDDITQVVLRLGVLELDVQTVLDAHLHLDAGVYLRRRVE